jgi:hypothetical protein
VKLSRRPEALDERDSFTLYLKEIGQTKLLTPEEEILGQTHQEGRPEGQTTDD